jgi:hypothetical protein
MAQHVAKVFHVSTLKIFHGDRDAAFQAAMLDLNQFLIKQFLAYRGDPLTRTTLEFEVEFEDGDVAWLPWLELLCVYC